MEDGDEVSALAKECAADAARILAQNFRLLEKAPVRLGVMSTVGHLRLARFLARFDKTHTGMELAVSEGSVAELTDRLREGEVDIAIMTRIGSRVRKLPAPDAICRALCRRLPARA